MSWSQPIEVFSDSGPWSQLDAGRAFGPCVLQDGAPALRMWYSGHDGSTCRILSAVQEPGENWVRRGVAIDVATNGDSDAYGVESPCVVTTSDGYLMCYAGSDGATTRLHMASSRDGGSWEGLGTILPRGEPDAVGATHPCMVTSAQRTLLYYAGYDGGDNGRRAAILGAAARSHRTWDRVGPLLEPEPGETAVVEPWVLISQRRYLMFYVSDDGNRSTIDLASSDDGMTWRRRGVTLTSSDADLSRVRSPCAVKLRAGILRLWYAEPDPADTERAERLWMTDLIGGSL